MSACKPNLSTGIFDNVFTIASPSPVPLDLVVKLGLKIFLFIILNTNSIVFHWNQQRRASIFFTSHKWFHFCRMEWIVWRFSEDLKNTRSNWSLSARTDSDSSVLWYWISTAGVSPKRSMVDWRISCTWISSSWASGIFAKLRICLMAERESICWMIVLAMRSIISSFPGRFSFPRHLYMLYW